MKSGLVQECRAQLTEVGSVKTSGSLRIIIKVNVSTTSDGPL